MKKKWLIGGIASIVVLGGGAFGVSAVSGDDQFSESEVEISQKEAETTAKKEVDGLTIDKVEKDKEDGVSVYEFEGQTEDGKEAEVEVDANTGEVLQVERGDDDSNETSAEDMKVTEEEAEKAAKEEASGSEMKNMEIEDGHYEFEFQDDSFEYEITVDGQTGEVTDSQKEKLK
ncbi:PepSY domain-containing protein [Halobacillus sp. HZG1]|nr:MULTISPECIES: PepSY domain-containing protein [Halobacillus]MEC3883913.1 PepSY domain-containing protein [Halobacillus sp. HZG1]